MLGQAALLYLVWAAQADLFISIVYIGHLIFSPISSTTLRLRPSPLRQQLLNMLAQPVLIQHIHAHILRTRNLPPTFLLSAETIKRLAHLPLGAWVKECQFIPLAQPTLQVGVHPHLPRAHVEDQRRCAAVIDVHQVAVQLNVECFARLHRRVGAFGGCWVGDAREDGAWGEGYEGAAQRCEGTFAVLDTEETGQVGLHPCGDFGGSGWLGGAVGAVGAIG